MKRLAFALFVFYFAPQCFAQTGYPLYASFQNGPVDSVNLLNLNQVVSLPAIQTPGRGGLGFAFSPHYNSLVWTPSGGWQPAPTGGWVTSPVLGSVTSSSFSTSGTCGRCTGDTCGGITYQTIWSGFVYVDPVGTPHGFGSNPRVTETYNSCLNRDTFSGTWGGYSSDSLYYISIGTPGSAPSGAVVWSARTGVKIDLTGQVVTDTNGNYTNRVYVNQNEYDWKDGSGRVAMRQIQNGSNVEYHYYDPNGNDQKFVLVYQKYSVMTNFGCSGTLEYNASGTLPQWSLPSEFDLPNGQKYTFTYEATPGHSTYITGRLAKITVPGGGTYSYTYGGSNDGVSCNSGSITNLARTISDGTTSATWNYLSTGLTTTVTAPKLADTSQANDTVITFNGAGQETSRKIYPNSPGTGTPLRTINSTWATNGSPATKVMILEDGTTQSEVDTTIDQYGLLDAVSEYDFGSGSHGPLLRTTNLTYNTSTNYTNLNIRNLVTSKQIKDGTGTVQYRQDTAYDGAALANCPTGIAQHDDADYPCTFNYRGNPTQVTTYQQPATPGGGISKNFTYDFFGNLLTAQLNCCQSKTWSYSSTTQYSKPDSVTSGSSPSLTTSFQYNTYTGLVTSSTDPNNLSTIISYDSLFRPTQAIQKVGGTQVGGTASMSYDDTNFVTTTTTSIDSSKSAKQVTSFDKLGRPYLSTTEDVNNNVISKVSAQYDLAGRAYQTSNPYTGSSTTYWTVTQFDVLGRPTNIAAPAPDSSATTISYSTNTTTVTDPTGKQRKSQSDAAGRLVSVWEPDPANNNTLTLQTSYTYNVLDELTQISQGVQTRTSAYDALGRILSATTPEAGRVCFGSVTNGTCNADGYDSFDNLLKRTDARGVLTSYGYDTLNRLTSVSYNVSGASGVPATPSLGLTYGNDSSCNSAHGAGCIGQLITMTDGVGSENYTYNNLEQLTQLQKVVNGTTYTTSYAFNLAGELTQLTYPSGRVVQQSVDAVGRLCEVAPSTTGCGTATNPFATALSYSATGQTTGFKYGNGIYASFGFSPDRLQLNCLDYSTTNRNGSCTHDSTTKFGLSYSYPTAPSNNGLISSITDSVESGRSASYSYDSLYRLVTAQTVGSSNYPAWGLSETYDRYGNRSAQTAIPGAGCVAPMTCPQPSFTVSASTNRLVGPPYAYDASGNMTNDGINTIVYDAENHTTSATNGSGAGTYVYDGNGHRVQKCVPNCTSPTLSAIFIYSGSQIIDEYDNGAALSSPTNEYVYAGNLRVAHFFGGTTYYWLHDHLSLRVRTDTNGNIVDQRGTFPLGETWYAPGAPPYMFTNYYYRDSESGNDYAQARYYVSGLGRFSSPDPIAGSTTDPQSLNRYSYVRNMPVMMSDPSGMVMNCNTVENRDANQQQDSKTGGPFASSTDADTGEPEPQRPTGGCGYSGGGGGFSDGSWLLDGGFVGDDSGIGGVPGDGGGLILWHGSGYEGTGAAYVLSISWGSDFWDDAYGGGGGGGIPRYKATNKNYPDACEKMAELADSLAKAFANDPVAFAVAFGDAIVGVGGNQGTTANSVLTSFGNTNYTPTQFGVGPSTGPGGNPTPQDLKYPGAFQPQFRDSLEPASDQSHHFAAFVELGAEVGYVPALAYAYWIDGRYTQGPNGDQANWGDVRLGEAGAMLGSLLQTDMLSLADVGNWIRKHICNP